MLQPATPATLTEFRSRGLETAFLVERYHRAFDEELALVRLLVDCLCDSDKRAGGPRTLRSALLDLEDDLAAHQRLQERDLFPAYERAAECDAALFEHWIGDCSRLFACAEAVRGACDRARDEHSAVIGRVEHLIDEIEQHLVAEVKLLAPWAGVQSDL